MVSQLFTVYKTQVCLIYKTIFPCLKKKNKKTKKQKKNKERENPNLQLN